MFGSIKNEKEKVNVKGIGLGLVISKMIVKKFYGEIFMKSKYKKGTEFTFNFEIEKFGEVDINSS